MDVIISFAIVTLTLSVLVQCIAINRRLHRTTASLLERIDGLTQKYSSLVETRDVHHAVFAPAELRAAHQSAHAWMAVWNERTGSLGKERPDGGRDWDERDVTRAVDVAARYYASEAELDAMIQMNPVVFSGHSTINEARASFDEGKRTFSATGRTKAGDFYRSSSAAEAEPTRHHEPGAGPGNRE